MDTAKNFKGFTLIELLVGITVTSIVFTVGYAGFREFSRRQALTGVTKMVVADLRQIQQLALTGQKPTGGVSCLKLIGYSFVRTGASVYELRANCDNTLITGSPILTSPVIKTTNLNGVTFTATTASTMFKVLGQGTNLNAVNSLTFTHTATNTNAIITIGIGGEVR